jgi:hypothetical protein
MSLDSNVLRRLTFAKYLYSLGVQQSRAAEPLAAVAILMFHDAAELFLQLASEYLDADTGKGRSPTFMEYWKTLETKLPQGKQVSQLESMKRLNNARVAFKHHGTLPSKLDIEAFRATTTAFFEDNTPLIFGESFSIISLCDVVRPDAARNRLKIAETALEKKNLNEALSNAAIAFREMLEDYENRKRDRFGNSQFFFGQDLGYRVRSDGDDEGMRRFAEAARQSIEEMQEAIKLLAIGIDYRQYSRFCLHIPQVNRTAAGDYKVGQRHSAHNSIRTTEEDARFCIDFVIYSALRLLEFDYDVEHIRFN